MDESEGTEFAGEIVMWYRQHKRSLPWRQERADPYAVWVSEIMLQQTTVAAVTGYFEGWMKLFPTVEALAAADLDQLLRAWSGLGYYARARNMKRAAEVVCEKFGARLPSTTGELGRLPGIGKYTAGAIASIGFNVRAPVVDANVARVLSRVQMLDGDPRSSNGQARLWELAAALVPKGSPSDFNQGLMDLGATVCTPANPECRRCPVSTYCMAFRTGSQANFPTPLPAKKWEYRIDCAIVLQDGRQILLVKRPPTGVWAGMWELPRATVGPNESFEQCAQRALEEAVGTRAIGLAQFGMHRHVVMNQKISLRGYAGEYVFGPLHCRGYVEFAWVLPDEIQSFAMASPQKRLIAAWGASRHQPSLGLQA